jgi:predicted porin
MTTPSTMRNGLPILMLGGAMVIAGGAGAVYAADVDTMVTKAPVLKAAPAPTSCTDIASFFLTDCQLSWYGVRFYGTIDVGVGYQTNGAPLDKFFPTGASYFLQKMNRQAMWGLAPNALSQSNVGVQITEPLGGAGWKFVGQFDFGFDPFTGQFASGPGSLVDQFGKPVNQQTTAADSGRNGTWYNGQLFAGVSNDTYGTLTAGRQNSLTLDGVLAYDPMGGAYAFSPIGFSGKVPGGGNTEDTRYNESVKYRVNISNFRLGAIVEYGGQDLGNGAGQAFEASGGGDFQVGPGIFSFDAIGGYMKDAVNLGLGNDPALGHAPPSGINNALSATISNNTNVMLLAKYTVDKLKLYAGYEWVHYAPSDDFASFRTDFTVLDNANTGFNPVTVFANQQDQIFHVFWAGAKYSITASLDIIGAYYEYLQSNAANAVSAGCFTKGLTTSSSCSGTMNAASVVLDWRFAPKWDTYIGTFWSETSGGLNAGFLARDNIATTGGVRFRF